MILLQAHQDSQEVIYGQGPLERPYSDISIANILAKEKEAEDVDRGHG